MCRSRRSFSLAGTTCCPGSLTSWLTSPVVRGRRKAFAPTVWAMRVAHAAGISPALQAVTEAGMRGKRQTRRGTDASAVQSAVDPAPPPIPDPPGPNPPPEPGEPPAPPVPAEVLPAGPVIAPSGSPIWPPQPKAVTTRSGDGLKIRFISAFTHRLSLEPLFRRHRSCSSRAMHKRLMFWKRGCVDAGWFSHGRSNARTHRVAPARTSRACHQSTTHRYIVATAGVFRHANARTHWLPARHSAGSPAHPHDCR